MTRKRTVFYCSCGTIYMSHQTKARHMRKGHKIVRREYVPDPTFGAYTVISNARAALKNIV